MEWVFVATRKIYRAIHGVTADSVVILRSIDTVVIGIGYHIAIYHFAFFFGLGIFQTGLGVIKHVVAVITGRLKAKHGFFVFVIPKTVIAAFIVVVLAIIEIFVIGIVGVYDVGKAIEVLQSPDMVCAICLGAIQIPSDICCAVPFNVRFNGIIHNKLWNGQIGNFIFVSVKISSATVAVVVPFNAGAGFGRRNCGDPCAKVVFNQWKQQLSPRNFIFVGIKEFSTVGTSIMTTYSRLVTGGRNFRDPCAKGMLRGGSGQFFLVGVKLFAATPAKIMSDHAMIRVCRHPFVTVQGNSSPVAHHDNGFFSVPFHGLDLGTRTAALDNTGIQGVSVGQGQNQLSVFVDFGTGNSNAGVTLVAFFTFDDAKVNGGSVG